MGLFQMLTGRKREVVLPISLSKVGYMVAGERAYEGDLIITHNVIYYFPHTDLIRRRIEEGGNLSAALLLSGNVGGAIALALANNLARSKQRAAAAVPTSGDITASLEEKLDAYVKKAKEERRDALLNESLPAPMRFEKSRIEKMRLTFGGFTFDANYDDHQFTVGDGGLLRGALKTGAYMV